MNRVERRKLSRKFNSIKGLKKKNTKGSFGKLSEYIMDHRQKKLLKKSFLEREKNESDMGIKS